MAKYVPTPQIQSLIPLVGKAWGEIAPEIIEQTRTGLARWQHSQPQVSIVLIGRNEEKRIFAALASLAQLQTQRAVELIVVNNGSTDATQEILDALGLHSVWQPTPGWAEARQAGLEVARGEFVLTADSDNLYPETWLDALVDALEQNEQAAVVCGLYCFFTDDNRYPPSISLYQHARYLNSKFRHPQRPHLNCLGGNMGYRRRIALKVGGYKMGVGRGEDGELSYRMSQEGAIIFLPTKAAFSYSSLRNVLKDGSLSKAFWERLRTHSTRVFENLTPHKE